MFIINIADSGNNLAVGEQKFQIVVIRSKVLIISSCQYQGYIIDGVRSIVSLKVKAVNNADFRSLVVFRDVVAYVSLLVPSAVDQNIAALQASNSPETDSASVTSFRPETA